jgi:hypothetical protein
MTIVQYILIDWLKNKLWSNIAGPTLRDVGATRDDQSLVILQKLNSVKFAPGRWYPRIYQVYGILFQVRDIWHDISWVFWFFCAVESSIVQYWLSNISAPLNVGASSWLAGHAPSFSRLRWIEGDELFRNAIFIHWCQQHRFTRHWPKSSLMGFHGVQQGGSPESDAVWLSHAYIDQPISLSFSAIVGLWIYR